MIFEKVRELIAKTLNVKEEEITLDTDLQNDLGADSLDAVDIMMALEDKFEIEISDEESQNLRKIKDIVTYLENNL